MVEDAKPDSLIGPKEGIQLVAAGAYVSVGDAFFPAGSEALRLCPVQGDLPDIVFVIDEDAAVVGPFGTAVAFRECGVVVVLVPEYGVNVRCEGYRIPACRAHAEPFAAGEVPPDCISTVRREPYALNLSRRKVSGGAGGEFHRLEPDGALAVPLGCDDVLRYHSQY